MCLFFYAPVSSEEKRGRSLRDRESSFDFFFFFFGVSFYKMMLRLPFDGETSLDGVSFYRAMIQRYYEGIFESCIWKRLNSFQVSKYSNRKMEGTRGTIEQILLLLFFLCWYCFTAMYRNTTNEYLRVALTWNMKEI